MEKPRINVLMLDFSNTITTVESEDMALKEYLNYVSEKENICDDNIFQRFTELRSIKLIEREKKFATFVEINREVLWELYRVKNIHEEEYYKFHEKYLRLRPDFIPFAEFVSRRVNIVMITDADNVYTERTVMALGIKKYFDYIITAEQVGYPKPSPEIFKRGMIHFNGKRKFWHVGDSEKRDILGAKGVGIFAVLMSDTSKDTTADAVVHNFEELKGLMFEKHFLDA